MPKRTSKPRDLNQLAASIVGDVTGERPPGVPPQKKETAKNPAAVALGKLGGLKGGKARAKKLSKGRRVAIARRAALARWRRPKPAPPPEG